METKSEQTTTLYWYKEKVMKDAFLECLHLVTHLANANEFSFVYKVRLYYVLFI